MFPNSDRQDCTNGFFCGVNTTQPVFCPEGYYCPNPTVACECPTGMFCPIASMNPYKCAFFASCPPGTVKPTRYGIFGFVAALAIFTVYFFYFKTKQDVRRRLDKELALKRAHQFASVPSDDPEEDYVPSKSSGGGGRVSAEDREFNIEFTDITRQLPNGVFIMKGVSGQLRAGHTCAVMGPSGAGKSTLFSLLTGKQPRTKGNVRIGGEVDELSKYAKLVGYVPQEDIMLRELTVSDILTHSAKMRLSASLKKDDIKNKVANTIENLGMSHVASSIIGTEAERGISGGQRKRVNIGMELVAEPKVLFLDEPTSGLDSSTSLDVCSRLRRIARQRRMTIAAVIHSPSPAAFEQFDDVILLGKGGRLVYQGPRADAERYFESIGFPVPDGVSPSDFYMDVLTGTVTSTFDPAFHPSHLFAYWDAHCAGHEISAADAGIAGDAAAKKNHSTPGFITFLSDSLASFVAMFTTLFEVSGELASFVFSPFTTDSIRETPGFFRVLFLCTRRAFSQAFRSAGGFLGDQVLHLGCGAFISIAAQNMEYLGAQPSGVCQFTPLMLQWACTEPIDHIREVGLFLSLGVLFAGISVGTQTYGNEMVVYWRDTSAGMPTLPYFLGKFLVDIPRIFIASIMFSFSMVLFWPYRSSFPELFLIILCLYYVAFAIGYALSTAISRQAVGLVGTGVALAWALVFSGVTPGLNEVAGTGFKWVWDISAPRYAIEALYLREVEARVAFDNDKVGEKQGYTKLNRDRDLGMILAIGTGWLALAFLGLKLLNRDKQK
ncbi:P-loop containing nucleoside triphosphate hydrolase protein [Blastocladiella britannica]|nr:P-loop containing nucleoside triphosphate hydrolase protein [Blastocladiella britannica]